jgi:plastocyanin
MPATANSFFQYTFNKAGDFSYFCEIHPWRAAITAINTKQQPQNQITDDFSLRTIS